MFVYVSNFAYLLVLSEDCESIIYCRIVAFKHKNKNVLILSHNINN